MNHYQYFAARCFGELFARLRCQSDSHATLSTWLRCHTANIQVWNVDCLCIHVLHECACAYICICLHVDPLMCVVFIRALEFVPMQSLNNTKWYFILYWHVLVRVHVRVLLSMLVRVHRYVWLCMYASAVWSFFINARILFDVSLFHEHF